MAGRHHETCTMNKSQSGPQYNDGDARILAEEDIIRQWGHSLTPGRSYAGLPLHMGCNKIFGLP
jgi:hypothetical protein